jgi:peptidoglycan/LPS O-acetylase OafA/YrhL
MKKFLFIDALRGLALFGVVVVHVNQDIQGLPSWLSTLASQGSRGVQLFFILSALTLFLSLNSRKRSEQKPLRNFFIRRFFRIVPLFYVALLFYGVQQLIADRSPWQFLSVLTFINGWIPSWINGIVPGSWSISIEMMFYLMVPFLAKQITTLEQAIGYTFTAMVASVGLLQIMRRLILVDMPTVREEFLFYWLPNQLPIFGLGFVLYFVLFSTPLLPTPEALADPEVKRRSQQRATLLLAMATFLLLVLPFGSFAYLPRHFIYGLAFVLLTLSLALQPCRGLVNKFWCYLGKVSFSGYLTHFPILAIAHTGLQSSLGRSLPPLLQFSALLGATLCGTLLVSTLTYHWIEVPGQAFGRRWIDYLERRDRFNEQPEQEQAGG